MPTGTRLGAINTLALLAPAARTFALGTDFTPLAVSTDGAGEGEVVFAGYGITAPDLQYDDYAGLDARDRIVIVITGDPRADDPASPFRRPEAYHYSQRTHKIINAREHGARAILLVSHPRERDDAPRPARAVAGPRHPGRVRDARAPPTPSWRRRAGAWPSWPRPSIARWRRNRSRWPVSVCAASSRWCASGPRPPT